MILYILRTISEDTWKSLQKFANENLRIPIEIDDIVEELINIAEIYFKSKKRKGVILLCVNATNFSVWFNGKI